MTNKKYNIIYADPPWSYKSRRSKYIANNSGETAKHYETMSVEDIKNLDIESISEDRCMLFLWVTFPLLKEGLDVLESWGFTYKTVAFSWMKTTKDGRKPAFGVGYYTRGNVEVCLLGIKGKPFKESSSVSSAILSPRQKHSQKPDEVRLRIEELVGKEPTKIELFARKKSEGWDAWGNEVQSDIQL